MNARLKSIELETKQSPVAGAAVAIAGIHKRFGTRQVLRGLTLEITAGSFVAVVGRSGCGKSTLLRLISGLEVADAGLIEVQAPGKPAPQTRVMFQDARLLPWKSVFNNVALGLKPGARERARTMLAEVGLADRATDWPAQLSGGQRQRVALARALAQQPDLLLLDEPLGALDALTRIEMHALIERLWHTHGFTALLVTHDVTEAIALADRVIVIEDGTIALDIAVHLPRPRKRDVTFSALEQSILTQILNPNSQALA